MFVLTLIAGNVAKGIASFIPTGAYVGDSVVGRGVVAATGLLRKMNEVSPYCTVPFVAWSSVSAQSSS
jgi:hypothetical protein